MKRRSIIALALLTMAQPAQAQTIELLHFWNSPAESAALQVFADSFRERGDQWHGTSRENELELKAYAIDRITSGFSPAAVQWHGGPEIRQLIALDVTRPLEPIVGSLNDRGLFPSVQSMLQVDGETGALPVGLHTENWAWINLGIYEQLGLSAPRDWEDFLDQAKSIRAAGYRPLAIGSASWERTLLFLTVLLDVGGIELYRQIIDAPFDTDRGGEQFRKAFEILLRLRDEATSAEHAHSSWNESTDDVMQGRAAMQVMGDWTKGEFLNAGKVLGQDFDCMPAPGNGDVMSLVLDVFVLPVTTDKAVEAAQSALVDIVLDPENQKRFARIKGSLPVIETVADDSFDRCARLGMSILAQPENNVPSLSLALSQDRIARIQGAIQKIWNDRTITAEQAAEDFLVECAIMVTAGK